MILCSHSLTNSEIDGANASTQTWLAGTLTTLASQIDALNEKRTEKLATAPITVSAISGVDVHDKDEGTELAPVGAELAAPIFGITPPDSTASTGADADPDIPTSDPFVTITMSFSAQDQQDSSDSSSWGMSVGGGVGWGLWSVGGSYSHDEASV
jgi:hypothetical protein